MFGITIVRQAPSSKKKGNKTSSSKKKTGGSATTDTGTAIALAMAAVKSPLPDGTLVPYANVDISVLRAVANGVRPNGTVGRWYPGSHNVAHSIRPAATAWLVSQGQTKTAPPKAAPTVAESQPAEATELALLKAQMALLIDALGVEAIKEVVEAPKEPEVETVDVGGVTYQVVTWKDGSKHLKAV